MADEETHLQPRTRTLDFLSTNFDPLIALYTKELQPPIPNIRVFNNLGEYARVIREGKSKTLSQPASKKESNRDSNKRTRNLKPEFKPNDIGTRLQTIASTAVAQGESLSGEKSVGLSGGIKDRLSKENPLGLGRGRTWKKKYMNVLEKMEACVTGPLSVLHKCLEKRYKVQVWIRKYKGLRSVLTGYVIAFDKHMNLALMDVDEVYTTERYHIKENPTEEEKTTRKKKKKKRKNHLNKNTDSIIKTPEIEKNKSEEMSAIDASSSHAKNVSVLKENLTPLILSTNDASTKDFGKGSTLVSDIYRPFKSLGSDQNVQQCSMMKSVQEATEVTFLKAEQNSSPLSIMKENDESGILSADQISILTSDCTVKPTCEPNEEPKAGQQQTHLSDSFDSMYLESEKPSYLFSHDLTVRVPALDDSASRDMEFTFVGIFQPKSTVENQEEINVMLPDNLEINVPVPIPSIVKCDQVVQPDNPVIPVSKTIFEHVLHSVDIAGESNDQALELDNPVIPVLEPVLHGEDIDGELKDNPVKPFSKPIFEHVLHSVDIGGEQNDQAVQPDIHVIPVSQPVLHNVDLDSDSKDQAVQPDNPVIPVSKLVKPVSHSAEVESKPNDQVVQPDNPGIPVFSKPVLENVDVDSDSKDQAVQLDNPLIPVSKLVKPVSHSVEVESKSNDQVVKPDNSGIPFVSKPVLDSPVIPVSQSKGIGTVFMARSENNTQRQDTIQSTKSLAKEILTDEQVIISTAKSEEVELSNTCDFSNDILEVDPVEPTESRTRVSSLTDENLITNARKSKELESLKIGGMIYDISNINPDQLSGLLIRESSIGNETRAGCKRLLENVEAQSQFCNVVNEENNSNLTLSEHPEREFNSNGINYVKEKEEICLRNEGKLEEMKQNGNEYRCNEEKSGNFENENRSKENWDNVFLKGNDIEQKDTLSSEMKPSKEKRNVCRDNEHLSSKENNCPVEEPGAGENACKQINDGLKQSVVESSPAGPKNIDGNICIVEESEVQLDKKNKTNEESEKGTARSSEGTEKEDEPNEAKGEYEKGPKHEEKAMDSEKEEGEITSSDEEETSQLSQVMTKRDETRNDPRVDPRNDPRVEAKKLSVWDRLGSNKAFKKEAESKSGTERHKKQIKERKQESRSCEDDEKKPKSHRRGSKGDIERREEISASRERDKGRKERRDSVREERGSVGSDKQLRKAKEDKDVGMKSNQRSSSRTSRENVGERPRGSTGREKHPKYEEGKIDEMKKERRPTRSERRDDAAKQSGSSEEYDKNTRKNKEEITDVRKKRANTLTDREAKESERRQSCGSSGNEGFTRKWKEDKTDGINEQKSATSGTKNKNKREQTAQPPRHGERPNLLKKSNNSEEESKKSKEKKESTSAEKSEKAQETHLKRSSSSDSKTLVLKEVSSNQKEAQQLNKEKEKSLGLIKSEKTQGYHHEKIEQKMHRKPKAEESPTNQKKICRKDCIKPQATQSKEDHSEDRSSDKSKYKQKKSQETQPKEDHSEDRSSDKSKYKQTKPQATQPKEDHSEDRSSDKSKYKQTKPQATQPKEDHSEDRSSDKSKYKQTKPQAAQSSASKKIVRTEESSNQLEIKSVSKTVDGKKPKKKLESSKQINTREEKSVVIDSTKAEKKQGKVGLLPTPILDIKTINTSSSDGKFAGNRQDRRAIVRNPVGARKNVKELVKMQKKGPRVLKSSENRKKRKLSVENGTGGRVKRQKRTENSEKSSDVKSSSSLKQTNYVKKNNDEANSESEIKTTRHVTGSVSTQVNKDKGGVGANSVCTARRIEIGKGKYLEFKRRHVNQLFVRGDNVVMIGYAT